MRFKVGDKVIVKSSSKRPTHWNNLMDKWMGKVVTIKELKYCRENPCKINEDNEENGFYGWCWKESDFLPTPKPGDKIKLRTWEDMKKQYGLYKDGDIKSKFRLVQDMKKYCGKIVTVRIVSGESFNIEEDSKWNWGFETIEEVYPKEEKMEFTKDMLKSGEHVVEYRNGDRRLYLNGYFVGPDCGNAISNYCGNLKTFKHRDSEFDVVGIYAADRRSSFDDILNDSTGLIWKRDEEPIEIPSSEAFAKLREIYGKEVKIVEDKDD